MSYESLQGEENLAATMGGWKISRKTSIGRPKGRKVRMKLWRKMGSKACRKEGWLKDGKTGRWEDRKLGR